VVKLEGLAKREELLPSELKRFGKRVHRFDYEVVPGEEFSETKRKLFEKIGAFVNETGGQLYTGIHSESDWTRDRWWAKGAHLVNRTLNFAVITKKETSAIYSSLTGIVALQPGRAAPDYLESVRAVTPLNHAVARVQDLTAAAWVLRYK